MGVYCFACRGLVSSYIISFDVEVIMKSLKEKIEVMQAALDGKEIQKMYCDSWDNIVGEKCQWNWNNFDYRIKPEPMEFWVNVYKGNEPVTAYETKKTAESYASKSEIVKTIKVREVIE